MIKSMSLEEIRLMIEESKKYPKLDIFVMDHVSLYPSTMRTMDPAFIRKQDRKRKIKNIYEPS